jgi:hypothetical protein
MAAGILFVTSFVALLGLLGQLGTTGSGCSSATDPVAIELGQAGGGTTVGATEYGGPGDPASGMVGSSGVNLGQRPDSFAELGGTTFDTATAMGGLAYETPLRITWPTTHGRSAIAYKRDIGLGGGPIDGYPRVIDLWWQLAGALGIPYEGGRWSGPVRLQRPPATGAASTLGSTPAQAPDSSAAASAGCTAAAGAGLAITNGPAATLTAAGLASAPRGAPPAVKGMIAAGNQIVGKPYLYGAGHGTALNQVGPAYDCSSSVAHLLWGGGLLPVTADPVSGSLESFGLPGPGRWVTIYASADHVFMYVAGLRWDTHNAAGPGDGSAGIGWHPLVREANGFVARHPEGL